MQSSGNFFFGKKYRFESLPLQSEKEEKRRVVGPYKAGLNTMSQVSLRIPGGSQAYAEAVYATLDTMMAELLSFARRRRRFARFRARKRNLHHMATSIAYGSKQAMLRNKRGRTKRLLKKKLYPEWYFSNMRSLDTASVDRFRGRSCCESLHFSAPLFSSTSFELQCVVTPVDTS